MNFLTFRDLVNLNSAVAKKYNITHLVHNKEKLESVVELPSSVVFGTEIFDSLYKKAAAMAEGIIRLHPFLDGNKRTALLSISEFLRLNGYTMIVPLSAPRFLVRVAMNNKSKSTDIAKLRMKICSWINKHSSSNDDAQKMMRIIRRYIRMLKIFRVVGKFYFIGPLIMGALLYNWLQLKIYSENRELLNNIQVIKTFVDQSLESLKQASKNFGQNNSQ